MRRTTSCSLAWANSLSRTPCGPQRLFFATQADPKQARLVLTAAGPDRVGVTAAITKAVVGAQGNVDSGRLTSLGGDYCIHMLVSVPEDQEEAFRQQAQAAVAKLGDWDLSIRKNTPRTAVASNLRQRLVSLSGEDKPGIMHAASVYLAEKGINVLSMNVYNEPAPFASSRLFKLRALVQVPDDLSDEQLEEGIEAVGEHEGVDMWLESSTQPTTPPAALHEAAPPS